MSEQAEGEAAPGDGGGEKAELLALASPDFPPTDPLYLLAPWMNPWPL